VDRQIRILIADDHPIFRQGLKQVIEMHAQFSVVAQASSGREAIEAAALVRPDIALLDVDMPAPDGFETARQLRRDRPGIGLVFLTLYKDETHLNEALDLGAHGYLVKDSAAADVVQCIKIVAAGGHYISPVLSSYVLKRRAGRAPRVGQSAALDELTPTEERILTRLAEYQTNKQIALELGVSIRTVENHRAHMCEKLGLQGAHALVRFAIEKRRGSPGGS